MGRGGGKSQGVGMKLTFKLVLSAVWKLVVKDPRNLFYPLRYWRYFLSGIYLLNGNRIFKHRSARIEQGGGRLLFGNIQHPFRVPPGYIRLQENAKLILTGDVAMADGVMIELGPGATLEIGGNTYINANTKIGVKESIRIGKNCAISTEVGIMDTDVHFMLDPRGNKQIATAPIEIGDHVWIGARCTILKGSRIDSGSVVGATSLVTGHLHTKSLSCASSCQEVRRNVEWMM
jgi:acetyltransferase-like isoleucine patch superfamily enzyme